MEILLHKLKTYSSQIAEKYNVSNPYNYEAGLYYQLQFMINTIEAIKLLPLTEQYSSSLISLSRNLMDSLSIINLIYFEKYKDQESLLRYYLFLADGYNVADVKSESIQKNLDDLLNRCEVINDREKFTNNQNIKKRNWKFKNKYSQRYSWNELYDKTLINESNSTSTELASTIQNLYSNYTHGLALNFLREDNITFAKTAVPAILLLISIKLDLFFKTNNKLL